MFAHSLLGVQQRVQAVDGSCVAGAPGGALARLTTSTMGRYTLIWPSTPPALMLALKTVAMPAV